MSHYSQSLSHKIKLIEKDASPKNMEIIYNELKLYSEKESKLESNIEGVCKLINLIGTYLVKGEAFNTTESQLIFDTFCAKDFMNLLLTYSTFEIYEINLEIIKTFSFLMINIKSTTYLYYFFSKNLLNRIINKDYTKYDEEFLSYYINFLKSLSLRLDEVSVQLFYDEKKNSFPIIENVIKLYNHRDSMIRNVVRNIILNILKIKGVNLQEHFTELPSVSYLANLACHLRDICIKINNDVENKNCNNLQYLYDDLIDEATYIDDLLNLNLNKINYIIINCMFYYFILPVICGALSETTNKISKKVAVFLIIFFFINMKNEAFKNCLFSLLFFEQLSQDLDYLLTYPQEKANYSFHPNNEKEPSFIQYISENYSSKFLLTIIQKDNIIYNKYKNNYPQLGTILQKCNGMYQKLMNKELLFIDVKEKIEMILNSFFNEEESNFMSQYHLNLSMSTGLGVGQYSKENTGEMYDICFLCYINPIFVDLKGIQRTDNSSYLNYKKNGIKEGLYNIIEKINDKDEDMILLINLLLFVVQQEDTNISSNLLRHVGLENIRQKIIVKESLTKKELNHSTNKKQNDGSLLSELCLNNNNFNYNNEYFQIIKDHKNKLVNSITMPLNLSKLLLIQHNDNNNNNQEMANKFLLPFIYRLILLNIINLSFNKNNSFELKKESNSFDLIIKNVENIYKIILESINSMIKENGNYRDIGYKIFNKKWKYYNEKINNKETLEIIKDYIMNTTFILLPEEHEKNEEEKYFSEIWRKESNIPNNIFENNLLLFMMIHDLREMLLINNGFFKNLNAENLIKNKFPLQNNESELNINNTYELQKLKTMKNFIQISVLYKCNEQQDFEEGELILLNKFSYFAKLIEEDKIKIKNKFNLNSIYLYQDNFNYIDNKENSIINFLIHENPPEINNENDKIDKLIYSVKFKDEKTKEEYTKYINDKCCSVKNDERMNFMSYLDKINNSIKDNEEDF
jgi:hypothetical protein